MALSGKRLRRRKKEDVFVFGYKIDTASELTFGHDQADETIHMFGFESPDLDKQVNFGTLSMTCYDKFVNNAILDLATRNDPGSLPGVVKQYLVSDLEGVDVWCNVKNADNTAYVKSIYAQDWTPGMPVPSGAANDKAQLVITGNSSLIEQFHAAWISGKKVVSTAIGQIGKTLIVQPRRTGLYALAVLAYKDDTSTGGTFNYEKIPVTATMVTQGGAVNFAEIEAARTQIGTPITGVYVTFLQTGTGVYPLAQASPDRLRT
jgi:hypothetical protein